ncbi:MAG TPA: hypothetical protein VNB64_08410 [Solirubrobacteraceae bacterium]|nr:hypothetical protein [Solirubrobacteraceae bacterium]
MRHRHGHEFEIDFQIAGATEDAPDEYFIRAGDSDQLQDGVPCGPDADGIFEAHFGRDLPRYEDAVLSALRDIRIVFPEAQLLEVRPDSLVTLDDIAERTGRTHESVRLLVKGKRGPGGFPAPAGGGRRQRSKVWRWYEVERWFEEELGVEVPGHRHGAFLAAVNQLLELQRVVPHVPDARRLAVLLPPALRTASGGQAVEDEIGAR